MKGYFHEEATLCSQVSEFVRHFRKLFRKEFLKVDVFRPPAGALHG